MKARSEKKTRSARGAGRLYKRTKAGKECPAESKSPGVFWLQYTLNGKRIRHALTGRDGKPITDLRQAEAERKRLTAPMLAGKRAEQLQSLTAALTQADTENEQAIEAAAPLLRIDDAWETYLKNPDRPDSGEGTLRNYAGQWERFERWLKEQDPEPLTLREITPQTAQDYAATLNGGTGTSPNTYNKHTAFLKMFFRVLSDAAGLKENPFEKIRRKNLKTNSRRELTLAELKDLLENATGDLQTLLYLGTFTGLRLGDCCTLIWGEVDLDRGLIRRVPNKTAKSGKPVLIGIPPALYAKLSEIPPEQRKGYVLPRFAEKYTYRNAKGRPSKQAMIALEIQAHFKDRKIQTHKEGTGSKTEPDPDKPGETIEVYTGKRAVLEVGFHSLRHTYVSLHAEAGTPQAMIQANVGHSNPAMTAHYTHVNEESARQIAGVLTLKEPGAEQPRAPLPDWARELVEELTPKNLKRIQKELLKISGTVPE